MIEKTRMAEIGNHEGVKIKEGVQASVDCARICVSCAKTVLAGVTEAGEFCRYSAEACDHYASEFERSGDPSFQVFANACRTFAGECRNMADLYSGLTKTK